MNLAQRIKARKQENVEFLRVYSVAVCDADENGVPVFGASGFFLNLPRGAVLVTAEHVIASITRGPRALMQDIAVDLQGQARFATETLRLNRRIADIATVPLDADELAKVPKGAIVPFTALLADRTAVKRGPYFMLGFHEPHQDTDRVAMTVELMQTHITLTEAKNAFYVNYRMNQDQQLLLGGRPSQIVGPRGRGGVPSFHGMSGSPVWRITTGATPSIDNHPPLVGLFVSQPNNSRKVLQVDRASLLVRHLKLAHPTLM